MVMVVVVRVVMVVVVRVVMVVVVVDNGHMRAVVILVMVGLLINAKTSIPHSVAVGRKDRF